MGFSRHRLCQQGLSGTGGAHQQGTLGQLCTNLHITIRIVKKIHDFRQGFLGFVFTSHVRKGHTGFFLDVHLGIGLADTHNASASGSFHNEHQEKPENQDR